jgi:hypothetical protein
MPKHNVPITQLNAPQEWGATLSRSSWRPLACTKKEEHDYIPSIAYFAGGGLLFMAIAILVRRGLWWFVGSCARLYVFAEVQKRREKKKKKIQKQYCARGQEFPDLEVLFASFRFRRARFLFSCASFYLFQRDQEIPWYFGKYSEYFLHII